MVLPDRPTKENRVKFRRKSAPTEAEGTTEASSARDGAAEAAGDASRSADGTPTGPFDIADVELEDSVPRVDLGSLLIAPSQGREVRAQVDEATQAVQSGRIARSDGALALR